MNDSSSVILGFDVDSKSPRLSLLTLEHVDLIMAINKLVSQTVLQDIAFRWSSLLIEINTVSDFRAHPCATGPACSFSHGTHTVSASVSNLTITTGTLRVHPASCALSLPAFRGYRVVVTAFWHVAAAALSQPLQAGLAALGFASLSATGGVGGENGVQPADYAVPAMSVGVENSGHVVPTGPANRSVIELCCSATSKLGMDRPESAGCARYRFTEQEDLTSPKGVRAAMMAVHESQERARGHLLIWVSIPCTGGCQ